MSNIAELSAKLKKKDSERSLLQDDIDALEELKIQGFVAKLTVSTSEGVMAQNKISSCEIKLIEKGTEVKSIENESKKNNYEFNLKLTDFVLEIFTIWEDGRETKYSIFSHQIPVGETQITELESSVSVSINSNIRVKTSMDSLVSIIESKQLELKEVVEQLSFIGKEAKNSSANTSQTNKPKNTKKNNSKKSGKSTSKESDSNKEEKTSSFRRGMATGQQAIMASLAMAFENRSVFLFGAAVAVVSMYGDYASV